MVFFSSKSLNLLYIQQISPLSFILLVFSHVANFRYVANFRFLTLFRLQATIEWACLSLVMVRPGSVHLSLGSMPQWESHFGRASSVTFEGCLCGDCIWAGHPHRC